MRYILGIDIGTSATKAVLFDENGKSIVSSMKSYDIITLQSGFAEQAPKTWWEAVIYTIKDVLAKGNIYEKDILGVGVTGQMHGLVLVDKQGEVLRDAILWCDSRSSLQCEEINRKIGEQRLVEICANKALSGFTASKILWVKENEPDIYIKTYKILLPKDYIRYKLVGEFASEPTDASGTNLFDIRARDWSDEILTKLDIDKNLMPKIYESYDRAGNITVEASTITGLSTKTILCMGASDNSAVAIGTGVVRNGFATTTIGTSGAILAYSDKLIIDKKCRIHTFCHSIPNCFILLSCTLCAGMSLKWFQKNFFKEDEKFYLKLERKIKEIPIGSEKLIFLPYLMGERSPILDEKARGVFFGLSNLHGSFHLARAIIEGVSFSQRQCLDVIKSMGIEINEMYLCGGGAKSGVWHQAISDLYKMPTSTLQNEEGAALGVAILAGVACGIYKNILQASTVILEKNIEKLPKNYDEYEKYYEIYKKLYSNLKDSFDELYEY